MATPKLAILKRTVLTVSAASSSGGPITRSQSQSFAENDTAVSFDIFGKEVSASDHVSAIDALMKKKQKIQDEKRQLQKELRSAQRRRQRLKRKAKELSQEDLVAVLLMREQEDLSKKRKAENKETPDPEKGPEAEPAEGNASGNGAQEEGDEESPSG